MTENAPTNEVLVREIRMGFSIKNGEIVYIKCPYCHEVFNINSLPRKINTEERLKYLEEEKTRTTICPHCKETLSFSYSFRRRRYHGGYNIFDNGDRVKLSFLLVDSGIGLSKNGKIMEYNNKTRHQLVFNIKTGMTYILPSTDTRTGKKYGSIMNISYDRYRNPSFSDALSYLPEEAIIELSNLMFSKLGIDESIEVQYAKRKDYKGEMYLEKDLVFKKNPDLSLTLWSIKRLLILLNRAKFLNIRDVYDSFIDKDWQDIKSSTIRKALDLNLKMPNSIKKACGKNIFYRAQYILLQKQVPNMSVDNKKKILFKMSNLFGYLIESDYEPMLFKRYFPLFDDETIATNKLLKVKNLSIVSDSVRMLEEIKAAELFDKNLLKGTIEEIHDRATKIYKLIGELPLKIELTKEEENMQYNINGYSICCADNTAQLHWAGSEMDICVGSYSRRAISKSISIFLVLKDNNPVVCIEKIGDGIYQAKAYGNNRNFEGRQLNGELADVVVKWLQTTKLKPCGDIKEEALHKEKEMIITREIDESFKKIAYDYLEEINKNVKERKDEDELEF